MDRTEGGRVAKKGSWQRITEEHCRAKCCTSDFDDDDDDDDEDEDDDDDDDDDYDDDDNDS